MPAAINQSSDENAQMPSNEQEQEASNGAEPKMAESELKTDVTSEKYGIDDLFSWFFFLYYKILFSYIYSMFSYFLSQSFLSREIYINQ